MRYQQRALKWPEVAPVTSLPCSWCNFRARGQFAAVALCCVLPKEKPVGKGSALKITSFKVSNLPSFKDIFKSFSTESTNHKKKHGKLVKIKVAGTNEFVEELDRLEASENEEDDMKYKHFKTSTESGIYRLEIKNDKGINCNEENKSEEDDENLNENPPLVEIIDSTESSTGNKISLAFEKKEHCDNHQESFSSTNVRNRKVTQAPIFKEIVKRIIAANSSKSLPDSLCRSNQQNIFKDHSKVDLSIELKEKGLLNEVKERCVNGSEEGQEDSETKTNNLQSLEPKHIPQGDKSEQVEEIKLAEERDTKETDESTETIKGEDMPEAVDETQAKMLLALSGYEVKVESLQNEMTENKSVYEKKLKTFNDRMQIIESQLKEAQNKKTDTNKLFIDKLRVTKTEMEEQFIEVTSKIEHLNEQFSSLSSERQTMFRKVENDLESLQCATSTEQEKQLENFALVDNNAYDCNAPLEKLEALKTDLVQTNSVVSKRILEASTVVKNQRRSCQSSFLELETETEQMKVLLSRISNFVKSVEASIEAMEGGKRKNLIFHGLVPSCPESKTR